MCPVVAGESDGTDGVVDEVEMKGTERVVHEVAVEDTEPPLKYTYFREHNCPFTGSILWLGPLRTYLAGSKLVSGYTFKNAVRDHTYTGPCINLKFYWLLIYIFCQKPSSVNSHAKWL